MKKYIFSTVICLVVVLSCFSQNPALISSSVSPDPVLFPGGTAKVSFRLNNNSQTATNSPNVTVEVGLSKLNFTNSTFNLSTDIAQTSGIHHSHGLTIRQLLY